MTQQKGFKHGDIVINHDIATSAGLTLSKGNDKPDFESLAQLISSIVTHEKIIIPAYDPMLNYRVVYSAINDILEVVDDTHEVYPLLLDSMYQAGYNLPTRLQRDDVVHRTTWVNSAFIFARKYGLSLKTWYRADLPDNATDNQNLYSLTSESILSKIEYVAIQQIEQRNSYTRDYFKLEVPVIFNYVIEKATSRDDILLVAMELRESKEARSFRKTLTLLDEAASVDNRKVLMQIIDEIDDKIKSLSKKVEQPTIDLDIGLPLSAALSIGQLAKFAQYQIVRKRKRHLLFIEQLYNSGIQARSIQRHLGKLLD